MVLIEQQYQGNQAGSYQACSQHKNHRPYQGLESAHDREPTTKQVIGIPSSLCLDRDVDNLPHFVCDFFYDLSFVINL
jgi:hypothetical protein